MAKMIKYRGFNFVTFGPDQTRITERTFRDSNYIIACLFTNGNIATNYKINSQLNTKAKEKLSYFLYRLQLISREDWEADYRARELAEFDNAYAGVEAEAETLGYRLVKIKQPKKAKV